MGVTRKTEAATRTETCWLVVEREENWFKDARHGFRVIGFPERMKKRAHEISQGDLLVVYVASGRSSITGTRRVLSVRPSKKIDLFWDDFYPIRIETEPLTVLKEPEWIKIHGLIGKLSFTREQNDWRQCFRVVLRRLEREDARILLRAIEKSKKS